MTGCCKGEVNPLLEVCVCSGEKLLEFNGTGDEGVRTLGSGCLAESMGINNALDLIDGRGELGSMLFDG